jgi:hypothetical protein
VLASGKADVAVAMGATLLTARCMPERRGVPVLAFAG